MQHETYRLIFKLSWYWIYCWRYIDLRILEYQKYTTSDPKEHWTVHSQLHIKLLSLEIQVSPDK